ncbi:MAG: D-alanyl-D-alanine carboxypeptidase/D-alanyl-D-alanine-endopeptidase [Chloroherpetonaceae bacterium]|nr:D-alanyl-D-alanine carboxypeptidase/D-alanyl-D-alanine-endopeptidase [Chloroherpetonaceae bacterium]MDW8437952.1 D-alanyl-D-alanine carboxypeptidase/D-alanyl-D-alanine-endopeptidase [Chloroherpetonaceae bacterium]
MPQRALLTILVGTCAWFGASESLLAQKKGSVQIVSKQLSKRDQRLLKELHAELDKLFFDEAHSNTFWGVLIESLNPKFGALYALNAEKNFVPASNQKLLTTAAALRYLGEEFRFQTSARTWGKIVPAENGAMRLDGDLIIASDGNPYHADRFVDSTGGLFLYQLADSLLARNITLINGDLVADDQRFQASVYSRAISDGDGDYSPDWAWDDLFYGMAAPASALAFNENSVTVVVYPADSVGKAPDVVLEPNVPNFFEVENLATTGQAQTKRTIEVVRRFGTNRIVISGSIPIDSRGFRERIAVERPALYFLAALKDALERKGIRVAGKLRRKSEKDCYLTDTLEQLASQFSPPMLSILSETNKASNNFFAEQLLRRVGYAYRKEGSASAGLDAIKLYLDSIGVAERHFHVVDGCGLSRKNRLSPAAIVKLLKKNYLADSFETFYQSLAVAGIDGTLQNRFREGKAKGMTFAKTGFIGGVRTLSGYLYGEDEEWIAFSIMAMNFTQSRLEIEQAQDRAIELVAEWAAERARSP